MNQPTEEQLIKSDVSESSAETTSTSRPGGSELNLGQLFLGGLFVSLGALLLSMELGLIAVDVYVDWFRLWPLLVIFLGLSFITVRGFIGTALGVILTVTLILGTIFLLILNTSPGCVTTQFEMYLEDNLSCIYK